MYAEHVPKIAAAMRQSADIFARGCMFAVLSARVQFIRVPENMIDLDKDGQSCAHLWAWKLDAYSYISEHKARLHAEICAALDTEAALWVITRIPGMGLAKGAFVLQLMGHDIACLDVRNIQRDKRNARAYRSDGDARKNTKAFRRKLARYVADTGGKARAYWDAWCIDVSASYGISPEECSAMHLAIIPRGFKLTRGAQKPNLALLNQDIPF